MGLALRIAVPARITQRLPACDLGFVELLESIAGEGERALDLRDERGHFIGQGAVGFVEQREQRVAPRREVFERPRTRRPRDERIAGPAQRGRRGDLRLARRGLHARLAVREAAQVLDQKCHRLAIAERLIAAALRPRHQRNREPPEVGGLDQISTHVDPHVLRERHEHARTDRRQGPAVELQHVEGVQLREPLDEGVGLARSAETQHAQLRKPREHREVDLRCPQHELFDMRPVVLGKLEPHRAQVEPPQLRRRHVLTEIDPLTTHAESLELVTRQPRQIDRRSMHPERLVGELEAA